LTHLSDLDTAARDLFQELSRTTEGNTRAQASMYVIGETIGLDREASARAAEDLIAQGFAEIRTLSGDIGLSEEGARLLAGTDEGGPLRRLGTESPLSPTQYEMVEQTLTHLKSGLGGSGLAFEALSEMVADIRTIEAQLASPKAKTMIVRECFASLLHAARECRQKEWQQMLGDLLG
jgi:hypothetical protein